jgi:biotin-[acetyl-CoA-carboxylase] ligase BirA-like protein
MKAIGRIIYLNEVDSTNNYAKGLAKNPFADGLVVVAERQTSGKGRLGKSWCSPRSKGIYMTYLYKADIDMSGAAKITLFTACSVLKAISEVTGIEAGIKWPNDIIVGNKKVCGILVEMGPAYERFNYIAVGIGLNVNLKPDDIPVGLRDRMTSLRIHTGRFLNRKPLIAAIIRYLDTAIGRLGNVDFFTGQSVFYKKRCLSLGRWLRIEPGVRTSATGHGVRTSAKGHGANGSIPDGSNAGSGGSGDGSSGCDDGVGSSGSGFGCDDGVGSSGSGDGSVPYGSNADSADGGSEHSEKELVYGLDISDDGYLIVQAANGLISEISSGEVSVRGVNGYI